MDLSGLSVAGKLDQEREVEEQAGEPSVQGGSGEGGGWGQRGRAGEDLDGAMQLYREEQDEGASSDSFTN